MMDSKFSDQFIEYLEPHIDELLNDLSGLIAIPSVRDLASRTEFAPFGQPIRQAFDYLIEFAKKNGLEVRDHQGYALDISVGQGDQEIALLHHVDVVSAGDETQWRTPPYQMTRESNLLFGRGVTDNKGPLMASLYILKLFKQMDVPLTKKIRVIIGGAEETTWECVEHYFQHNPQPDFGFSPDGDFPIVNGEKGTLYATLERKFPQASTKGTCQIIKLESERDRTSTCHRLIVELAGSEAAKVAQQFAAFADVIDCQSYHRVELSTPWEKSRNPHRVDNCMDKFVDIMRHVDGLDANSAHLVNLLNSHFANSHDGHKLGLNHQDDEMGPTTSCVSAINLDSHGYNLDFDFRFPKGLTIEQVRSQLRALSQQAGVNFIEQQYLPLSYLSPESALIQTMGKAYSDVTGMDAECFSKGAASYARALEHGVAFGPTFPGEVTFVHEPNEQLNLESLIKAITIYVKVLISFQE
ncbi:Sapep family Mn(2+)-dependent dipeptidase [Vibrio sp. LaRot3]|uniref:Sapep family Mn(2+)-dependent dipeptidase n=1 Tax=Vibrio sp. LaRot3 TaxID=2998829 RepID=UPI0022CDC07C|nr:Sapep family Mn(2+)-dependent dipeptidase [Vibrio sp. LaRot3]MDA0150492.1 Sapep family Mn(2+)-dependent dipeptidase [Vibrio sp. LaRot3]